MVMLHEQYRPHTGGTSTDRVMSCTICLERYVEYLPPGNIRVCGACKPGVRDPRVHPNWIDDMRKEKRLVRAKNLLKYGDEEITGW